MSQIKVRVLKTGRPHPGGFQFVCVIDSPYDVAWLPLEGDEILIAPVMHESLEQPA